MATALEKLKGNVFIGLFGKRAGLKLLHWLDPCCTTFCDDVKNCVAVLTPSAINSTATATVEEILGRVITSTSAAATTITTPSAEDLIGGIPGAAQGTTFDLIIDNSAGSNTVTLGLGTGITAPTGAITGGTTLTVTTTHKVGVFKFYFTSATTAVVYRIA